MTRLNQFLDVDDKARDEAAKLSSLAGIAAFALAKFLDIEGRTLGWFTVGAIGCCYLLRVWWYCSTSQRRPEEVERRFLIPRRIIMAAASACALVLFSVAPIGVVEAAVINRRLLAATRKVPLSSGQAADIADYLRIAASGPMPPTSTLVEVREAIRVSALSIPRLPQLADAAEALAKSEPASTGQNAARHGQAEMAYREGRDEIFRGLPSPPSVTDLDLAIDDFTRALALLGDDDEPLRARILIVRASSYLQIGKIDEALADADAAYDLGALNLSAIAGVEGIGLATRHRPEDLRRAVDWLTVGINLKLPESVLSVVPQAEGMNHGLLLSARASVYYDLKEFSSAIDDCRAGLDLAPRLALPVPVFYKTMILSYLQLGNTQEALKASAEWQERTGDPRAGVAQEILEANISDAKRALALISTR